MLALASVFIESGLVADRETSYPAFFKAVSTFAILGAVHRSVLHIEHAADLENVTLEDFIANKSANGWVDVQVETELTLLGFHQFMGMNGKSPYHTPKKGEDGSWSALMYPNSWI